MKKLLLFFVSVVLFTSCYTTWTTVGNYKQLENQGLKTYKYDQAKQFYLFGGLLPLGHANANVPNEPCEIKTKFKFVDLLISTVTCEILTSRTVQVYAFEGGNNYPLSESSPQIKEESSDKNFANEVQSAEQNKDGDEQSQKNKKAKKGSEPDSVTAAPNNDVKKVAKADKKTKTTDTLVSAEPATKEMVAEPAPQIVDEVEPAEEPQSIAIVPASQPQSSPTPKSEPEIVSTPSNTTTPVQQTESQVETNIIVDGAILAPFSVGANKKVHFSQGNLQYQASSKTWRFAEQQYEMIGADNNKISSTNSSWIDLFGWGTSGWFNRNTFYMPYDTESASATYGYGYGPTDGRTYEYSLRGQYAEADWGVSNLISEAGDSAGMWRTLTRAEWGYLLLKRPNAVNLYSLAIVDGTKGIIILPDDWFFPTDCKFIARTSFELNNYSLKEWKKMESYGAVFLPTAGCRYGTTVGNVGTTGSYWTASAAGGENAWYFVFNKTTIDISSDYSRALGRSVRLVQDIQ